MRKGKYNLRNRSSNGGPNPVDAHIGNKIRERRLALGMSQSLLGEAMGLTFQQVQKYESGANRVGGSRLFDLGRALNCPVGLFFDGLNSDTPSLAQEVDVTRDQDRSVLAIVRNYRALSAPLRAKLNEIALLLANTEQAA